MRGLEVIEALGVPVVPVAGMPDAACWVTTQGVALVRPDLTEDELDGVLDYLLPRAIVAAGERLESEGGRQ